MNYELAKKLKDAGFPQKFKNGNYYAEPDLTFKETQIIHLTFPKTFYEERVKGTPEADLASSKCVSIPTLEELIEACGDNFAGLAKSTEDGSWIGIGNNPYIRVPDCKTPLEAVANLWLELNKKP